MASKPRDRVYTAIDLHDRRGFRAQLRVVAVWWRGRYRVHIREYYPNHLGVMAPGRGTNFSVEDVDRIIYGLQLLREDAAAGRLAVVDEPEEGGGEAAHAEQEPEGPGAGPRDSQGQG